MRSYWFISTTGKRYSTLTLLTVTLTFLAVLLGAYTRLTDAGLSCPDWPHCYGFITPPHTSSQVEAALHRYPMAPVNIAKAWTEMIHRYVAGTAGMFILILSFLILFTRRPKHVNVTIIPVALMTLLCIQVMLGMLTVTEKLKPVIVLAHLLTGLSLLSVLWWAYLSFSGQDDRTIRFPASSRPRLIWLWGGVGMVALQIALGGWVSTHYAGFVCLDFPYCNGQLLPPLQWNNLNDDLVTIHMLHRWGAIGTALYLGVLSFTLLKTSFRPVAILLFSLLALQLTVGMLNIIWVRPLWLALFHHALAIFLFLTLLTTLIKAYFQSRDHSHAVSFT